MTDKNKSMEAFKGPITYRDLTEKQNAIDEVASKDWDSGILTYRLVTITEFFIQNLKIYQKIFEKLRRTYAIIDDKGNWKVPPEKILKYNDEQDKVLDTEIPIDVLKVDFGEIILKPKQIAMLREFIDEAYMERIKTLGIK